MSARVLVTGGTGFVGSHLVRRLLVDGYEVRASVRRLDDVVRIAPLRGLADGTPGRLELVEADLLQPGAFDAAMAGCSVVFHVASPFLMPEQITDPRRELFEPAVEGTRKLLATIERTPEVRRLVLTSTVGAIFGTYRDVLDMRDRTLTEEYVNTSSTLENNPYHYAKTVAEQQAWAAARAQRRWDMVAINPGLILGPALVPGSASGSLFLMAELMGGKLFFGAPDFSFTFADVREVATAHVRAAALDTAAGRYVVARPEMVSFAEMARIIRSRHPRRLLVPRHRVPDWAVRVVGPRFGLTPEYIRDHLGIRFAVDNRRSVKELGLEYRPVAETVLDHYDSWRAARRPS